MKRALKDIVVGVLAWQTKRLQKKNKFKTVAVAGSYGKTSTKLAIAQVLGSKYRVRYQEGNYNDITTVPLIFFGRSAPPLFSPLAWIAVFLKNEITLLGRYDFDVVVVELGVDGPGQMSQFKKYLKVDLGLITAIAPEHMEFFDGVDDVAREELALASFSRQVLINGNLSPKKLPDKPGPKISRFAVSFNPKDLSAGWSVKISQKTIDFTIVPSSMAQLHTYANAAAAASTMDLAAGEIQTSLMGLEDVPGRMNLLDGKGGSKIIDDSYNASPDATKLALQTLYEYPAERRIALLGNMNELGDESEKHHRDIGRACDPKKLSLVVTLGPDANELLADEAEKKGCKVIRTKSPYEAAGKIESEMDEDTVLLAKGSQNGVFAEEAVKQLLANPDDKHLLVRQSPAWLKKKEKSLKRQ
jgi:UDP-N-acetylmuramyl pentapeptide synthase